jgi:hypothetical protein
MGGRWQTGSDISLIRSCKTLKNDGLDRGAHGRGRPSESISGE